ncbi:MAG TPA: enoyl-CoA hydratase-related protein [Lacipirellulaceae bacterium]|nr:enoyl-CoA hydratase-related protein [Lacipirellulaceae bacterium]
MTLLFEKSGHIATLTINRPESMNAMDPATYKQLSDAWIEVRDNPEIWVAVITGANNSERPPEKQAFTAGADLKKTIPQSSELWHFWQTQEDQILNRGLEVWKPVVAAVNGFCLAGGMTLLFATDIRIASEHASVGISEVKRGILPGNGGTQRAVHQLPYPVAMELLLVGDTLSAQEALKYGLVNRVVPHGQLMPATMEVAEKLAANPPLAVRAIKELAIRSQHLPLHDGLRLEQAIQSVLRQSEDAKEGPRAFAEKRAPVYRGR